MVINYTVKVVVHCKKNPFNFRFQAHTPGLSIIEILIAQTIFLMGISVAVLLITHVLNTETRVTENTQAIAYAKEGLTTVRHIRDSRWSELSAGAHGLMLTDGRFSLTSEPETIGNFTRTITIENIDSRTKKITSSVKFPLGEGNIDHTVSLAGIVTDFRVIPEAHGDWSNPRVVSSIDLGPEAKGTDLFISGNKLYVSAGVSSKKKPNLFSFNITDPSAPYLLGSASGDDDLLSIVAKNTSIYTAGKDNNAEFQLFTDNGGNPVLSDSTNLTGSEDGLSTAVSGNILAIGREARPNNFILFDISDPAVPAIAGNITAGGNVNGIAIMDSFAYLAVSSSGAELVTVDISDIQNPSIVGFTDVPGGGFGKSVFVNSNMLYFGKTSNSENAEFFVYNLADGGNPALMGSAEIGSDINDLTVSTPYAFLATSSSNSELRIFNISNPSAITSVSSLNLSQETTGIAFKKNRLYLSVKANDGLQVVGPGSE